MLRPRSRKSNSVVTSKETKQTTPGPRPNPENRKTGVQGERGSHVEAGRRGVMGKGVANGESTREPGRGAGEREKRASRRNCPRGMLAQVSVIDFLAGGIERDAEGARGGRRMKPRAAATIDGPLSLPRLTCLLSAPTSFPVASCLITFLAVHSLPGAPRYFLLQSPSSHHASL